MTAGGYQMPSSKMEDANCGSKGISPSGEHFDTISQAMNEKNWGIINHLRPRYMGAIAALKEETRDIFGFAADAITIRRNYNSEGAIVETGEVARFAKADGEEYGEEDMQEDEDGDDIIDGGAGGGEGGGAGGGADGNDGDTEFTRLHKDTYVIVL